MRQLFELGEVVATAGFIEALARTGDDALTYLARHAAGDWGEVDAGDWNANNDAIFAGDRILSVYRLSDGTKFWIITEWDRSATTFLLPEEY